MVTKSKKIRDKVNRINDMAPKICYVTYIREWNFFQNWLLGIDFPLSVCETKKVNISYFFGYV